MQAPQLDVSQPTCVPVSPRCVAHRVHQQQTRLDLQLVLDPVDAEADGNRFTHASPSRFCWANATILQPVHRCEVAIASEGARGHTAVRAQTGAASAVRQHLVDRRPPGLEALPGGAQVQPPDPGPLDAGEADGVVLAGVEAVDPVA